MMLHLTGSHFPPGMAPGDCYSALASVKPVHCTALLTQTNDRLFFFSVFFLELKSRQENCYTGGKHSLRALI